MPVNRVVRRVAKRTYDKYATADYKITTDNLNPVKPTQLESQLTVITQAVQTKVIEAFNRVKEEVPEELYEPDVSPTTMLNAIENLIKKLQKNPAAELANTLGLDALASSPILGGENEFLDNPMKLDCEGVKLPLVEAAKDPDDNSGLPEDADDDDSDGSDDDFFGYDSDSTAVDDDESNGAGEEVFTITYHNLLNSVDAEALPKEYTESDCKLDIPSPATLELNGTAYRFDGWYKDELYNTILADNQLSFENKNVDLYALFQEVAEDDQNDSAIAGANPAMAPDDDEDDCGTIELAFLKIILIIIIILGILIKVLVLVLNIMKVQADIIKEAQLAWINPPLLQSIISYVMERLAAIIFQIVGMILLKIWAMLNLDCISENALAVIDQINQALSGLMDLFGQIDALAIDFKSTGADFKKQLKEALENTKNQLANLGNDIANSVKELNPKTVWQNTKSTLSEAGQDIADTYTNPATYLAMVPAEIRTKVMNQVNAFKQVKKNAENTYQSMLKTKALLSGATIQDPPRGAETTVLL